MLLLPVLVMLVLMLMLMEMLMQGTRLRRWQYPHPGRNSRGAWRVRRGSGAGARK